MSAVAAVDYTWQTPSRARETVRYKSGFEEASRTVVDIGTKAINHYLFPISTRTCYGTESGLSIYEEAKGLFPMLRDMTADELDRYESALDGLFQSTGRNFFDL